MNLKVIKKWLLILACLVVSFNPTGCRPRQKSVETKVEAVAASNAAKLPLSCVRFQIRDCRPAVGRFMWYARIRNISSTAQYFHLLVVVKDEGKKRLGQFKTGIFELKPGDNYILHSRRTLKLPEKIYRAWRFSEVFMVGHSGHLGVYQHAPGGDIINFGP